MIKLYSKGYRKERKIVLYEKSLGRLAFRSAGSHSPIDVVSIDTGIKVIRLIQSKCTITERQRIDLLNKNNGLNGIFLVRFEVR